MMFNHKAHKELWGWLAANPHLDKEDWPGWDINGGEYEVEDDFFNYCFACAVCTDCIDCPLDWSPQKECTDIDSLYINYLDSKGNLADRSYYAKMIQNLPLKENYSG